MFRQVKSDKSLHATALCGVSSSASLGILGFYRKAYHPSKNTGDDGSAVPSFNRDQQHRFCRFVYDVRLGRINEPCMIGCAVTRNRSAISVLAPNDQRSDFIKLDFVRSCALSNLRWFRVSDRIACAFFRAQMTDSSVKTPQPHKATRKTNKSARFTFCLTSKRSATAGDSAIGHE